MPPAGPHEVAFAIRGPISRGDLQGLCDRVCAILGRVDSVVACDVAGVQADAVTVDALARLQLAAQRHGCSVQLRNASNELQELVELTGLAQVLLTGEASLAPTRPRAEAGARSAERRSRHRERT